MDQHVRELYCSRIIAGFLKYKEFRIYWPTPEVLYESCEVFEEVYRQTRDEGLLTAQDLHHELSVLGVLRDDYDLDIRILGKQLDDLKIEAYRNIKSGSLKSIKSQIEVLKVRIGKLMVEQHKFDHISCEGIATFAKWSWILENSIYKDGQLADCSINAALDFWNSNRIGDDLIRELSRTDPWQTYWQSKITSLFDKPSCNLNDEQRRLIVWSKMYDNIRESQDCPSEEVINDDDALDGWMLLQKRKRDKERRAEQIDASIKSDKIRNSEDIMIKAWTNEEAEEIHSLNDEDGAMFKKMRVDQVKKGKDVTANKLADMRLRKLKK